MNKRPVLKIPKTTMEKWHDLLVVLILLGAFGSAAYVWPQLPNTIPMHLNRAGDVNGWGGKGGLFVVPAIGTAVYAGLALLSRHPHVFNYLREITEENAHRQYLLARQLLSWLKVLLVVLFAYVEWLMIQLAFGRQAEMWGLAVIFAVMCVIVVVHLVKASKQ